MQITDCTIRDGGHVNNWEFSEEIVCKTYDAACDSGVDFFEIGYISNKVERGPWGCIDATCNDFIESIRRPECEIIGMIDCDGFDKIFLPHAERGVFKSIRLATYGKDLHKALYIDIPKLKDKGYKVYLSFMGWHRAYVEEILLLKNWNAKNSIEALTFADSFGSMLPANVEDAARILNDLGFERLCFHSHNNIQMSFINSLTAISEGVQIIDASVYGMGRGGGNLPMELFLSYLNEYKKCEHDLTSYLKLIESHFHLWKQQYNWGYDVGTLISGMAGVHPFYSDWMEKNQIPVEKRQDIANAICKAGPVHFDKSFVEALNVI